MLCSRQTLIAILCLLSPAVAFAQGAPFVPDDPYFFTGSPEGYLGQWHLDTQSTGFDFDVNVRGAWEQGLTGSGVTIGIIENQFNWEHPDLLPNFSSNHSWDFAANAPLRSGSLAGQAHATAVAGIAAARGGNGVGITGAAPHASIASLAVRPLEGSGSITTAYDAAEDQRLAAALRYRNSSASDGINIKSLSWSLPKAMRVTGYPAWRDACRKLADVADGGGLAKEERKKRRAARKLSHAAEQGGAAGFVLRGEE